MKLLPILVAGTLSCSCYRYSYHERSPAAANSLVAIDDPGSPDALPESAGRPTVAALEQTHPLFEVLHAIAQGRVLAAQLRDLDRTYGLSKQGNSEVLFAWLQLALANRYEPAVPAAERFLLSMGRRKFVAPLFETLAGEGEWGRPIADRIYARARPSYHSVTTSTVDRIMRGES